MFSLASGAVAESVDLLGSDAEVEAAVQKTLGLIDIMSSVFHNEYCCHSSQSIHHSFSSVASWQMYLSDSLSLIVGGGYAQVSASVSASFGTSVD